MASFIEGVHHVWQTWFHMIIWWDMTLMLYGVIWCYMMLYDVIWCYMMLYDVIWLLKAFHITRLISCYHITHLPQGGKSGNRLASDGHKKKSTRRNEKNSTDLSSLETQLFIAYLKKKNHNFWKNLTVDIKYIPAHR